jgi:hypothetical protein
MKTIQIQTHQSIHSYTGPKGWEEVKSPSLFLQLFRLSVIGLAVPAARFMALRLVYAMPERVSKLLFNPKQDIERHLLLGEQLMETVRWIWDEVPRRRWHVPTLRVGWRTLHGPGDRLQHMTFGQFMFVERYFEATQEEGKNYQQDMRYLAACLYLPKGEGFRKDSLSARARWMNTVPKDQLQAIRLNYLGLRYQLTLDFKEVFHAPGEEPAKKPTPPSATQAGWLDVALDLAGEDIRKLHDYEAEDLFLFMKLLQKVVIRARKMEVES